MIPRDFAPVVRQLAIIAATVAALALAACSPCRDICRDYNAVLSQADERAALTPAVGLPDQIAISVSESVLALTADSLGFAEEARVAYDRWAELERDGGGPKPTPR